jgi:predicted glutamine amidotransferase
MCGHVGIAGKLELKDEMTLKRLLIFDYFRGPDSTGFAALRGNGEVFLTKVASHPINLFDMKKFNAALNAYTSDIFLGHNRFATKGKVNDSNAHPFHCGHIVGAHNGTLESSSWKALETELGYETAVDSEAIFLCIEKIGIEKTVPLLQGAWALVWFNLEDKSLNFLRNDQRSFWYSYSEKFDKIIWASEWPTIRSALHVDGKMVTELYKDKEGNCHWGTQVDHWYRFDIEKLKQGSEKRPKPVVKELKGKEPTPVTTYSAGGGHGNFPNQRYLPKPSGNGTNSTTTGRGNTEYLSLVGSKSVPLAGYMTEAKFSELSKYGCSWCQADVEYGDSGITIYETDDAILCRDCSGNGNSTRIYADPEGFATAAELLQ